MDFQTYAVRELTAEAEKLAAAARKQLEATTAQLTANFEATMNRLRHDHSQLVNETERLNAENASLLWEKEEILEAAKNASRGALIDRLLDVFEQIANSKTVDRALIAGAQGLVGDFNRVAVDAGGKRLAQLGAETPPLEPDEPSAMVFPIVVRGETLATLIGAGETRPGGEG